MLNTCSQLSFERVDFLLTDILKYKYNNLL